MAHSTHPKYKRQRRYLDAKAWLGLSTQPTSELPGLRQDIYYGLVRRWQTHVEARATAYAVYYQRVTERGASLDTDAEKEKRRVLVVRHNVANGIWRKLETDVQNAFASHPATLARLRKMRVAAEETLNTAKQGLAVAITDQDAREVTTYREWVRQSTHLLADIDEMLARWKLKPWREEAARRRYSSSGRLIHPPIGKRPRTVAKRKGDPSFDGSFLS